MLQGDFEEETFISILIVSAAGYFCFIWIHKSKYTVGYVINDIKLAIFLSGTLLFLTPVLKSLTVTYSEDTIFLLVTSKFR